MACQILPASKKWNKNHTLLVGEVDVDFPKGFSDLQKSEGLTGPLKAKGNFEPSPHLGRCADATASA